MLEQILQHSEIGQYILDKSVATSSLTQKIDPYYTRFQQDYISPAMNSPELKKKIAGYAGTIVADTLYFTAEAVGRGLEMAVRGSLWAGKKGMDYIRHSRYPSQLKLAAGISIAMLVTYLALPRFDSPDSISNTNAYVLTVNSQNIGVLRRIGWLGHREQDYAIFNQNWQEEVEAEFERKEYGILVLTGHHGSGTDYLYGDRGEHLPFESLPSSDKVEAILLSACRTAADSDIVSENVYAPLKERFPHLKLIVGFTGTSLVDDGVIPQVLMGKERLRNENGISNFANYAIGVNPGRVGVAILKNDDSWEFRDARSEISYRR